MATAHDREEERRAVEAVFTERFVERHRRERFRWLLDHPKARRKLRGRLAHDLLEDLDPRWVFEEEKLDAEARRLLRRLEERFARDHPDGECLVISESAEIDGRFTTYDDALESGGPEGLLLVLLPANLARYWGEAPGGGPFVLMRPDP